MLFKDKIELYLPDSDITYYPDFFNQIESETYFKKLLKDVPWQQDNITVFGKTHKQPRLTSLFASNKEPYCYSGITMKPNPFSKELWHIKSRLESVTKTSFTTCLLNLYRDGKDSNGWHADDEKELGVNPVIASISFGAERLFKLKHKQDNSLKKDIILQNGSLLLMKGETQHYWLHNIPKTKKEIGKRINLTFRIITKKN